MSTVAFFDVACAQCGRKYGWYGRLVDQPDCPCCGHRPDAAALRHDQEEVDEFRQLLAEIDEVRQGKKKGLEASQWQKARLAAGLTLRQAARLLQCEPEALAAVERNELAPSEALAKRMADCYGG